MTVDITDNLKRAWLSQQNRIDPRVWFYWLLLNLFLVILVQNVLTMVLLLMIHVITVIKVLPRQRLLVLPLGLLLPTIFLAFLNVFLFHLPLTTTGLLISKFWFVILVFSWFYVKVDHDDFLLVLEALRLPPILAWQFSVAYRQIPFMFRKARELYEILVSRGIPLDQGFLHAARSLPAFIIPLLVQVQKDADQLSEATINRGWRPDKRITRINALKFKKKDLFMMSAMTVVVLLIIASDGRLYLAFVP